MYVIQTFDLILEHHLWLLMLLTAVQCRVVQVFHFVVIPMSLQIESYAVEMRVRWLSNDVTFRRWRVYVDNFQNFGTCSSVTQLPG